MYNKLKSIVEDKIKNLPVENKSLIVLKGIKLSLLEDIKIDLQEIANNRFSYFADNFMKLNRKVIIYEEFLMLKSFIVDQYDKIFILNNNIYMNKYPIERYFSNDVCQGLINHFTESNEEDDDVQIGKIDEIIEIYSGFEASDSLFIGVYYEDENVSDPKIFNINLFDENDFLLKKIEFDKNFVEIADETDYVNFIENAFRKGGNFNIRITNYTNNIEELKYHLKIFAFNFSDEIKLNIVKDQVTKTQFQSRKEYAELLKKYWHYDSFRDIRVYDMAALDEGNKITHMVSQEQVISDLVQQVENCSDPLNKSPRDLFFTAPTGAGKSAIFQIASMYLAEHEIDTDDGLGLFTIIISPLVALMNDMVGNLKFKNYDAATTITGDTSQILRDEIKRDIAIGKYHMLYIAPEMLLSRSSVEQLIGNRTIGMIVIDEAHIVTTWGKQFRPDYWFLGDHIDRLRKKQRKEKNRSFVIAAFTATAIYHGLEDMYTETRDSLHMIDPITYLGYVRREDIEIKIDKIEKTKGEKREYLTDKIDQLEKILKHAVAMKKKTLVYFPTISLIEQCHEYLCSHKSLNGSLINYVTKYYGTLDRDYKIENAEDFRSGKKMIMLATKAFGMGIDISDIQQVVHFAPTGNVCDYVQEIGRSARRSDLNGLALYNYDKRDFKHINRLHGLSCIKKYQIVEVVKKIYELYDLSIKNRNKSTVTKHQNAMLLDAENFTYLFNNVYDDNNTINNVKTAILLFQKDFEAKISFPPIVVRPIPLFSIGFFSISPKTQKLLLKEYPNCLKEINAKKNVCRVKLNDIWNKNYQDYSFPQFKYLLYSKNQDLAFNQKYDMVQTLCVKINLTNNYQKIFHSTWSCLSKIIFDSIRNSVFITFDKIVDELNSNLNMSKYKAQAICGVFLSSLEPFNEIKNKTNTVAKPRSAKNTGEIQYQFNSGITDYFKWVEYHLNRIISELNKSEDNELYILNTSENSAKEYNIVLGILEAINVLTFEMIGGANSQLYIYVNQYRYLKEIANNPKSYKNRLMEMIAKRHNLSVKMLTYIYENEFSSDQIWDILEDYFLGNIPKEVEEQMKDS